MHELAGHLSYIHSLGVDALLMTSLHEAGAEQPIDPALGTLDDLDELVRRASEYNIRVLAELKPDDKDLAALERLWLAHGVAGFYVPGATAAQLAAIRHDASGFSGQRIVIGDLAVLAAAPRGAETPQLVTDGRAGTQDRLTAASLRPAIEATQQTADAGHPMPLMFSDGPGLRRSLNRLGDGAHDEEIAKILAATLLTTRAGALLYWGQELGLAEGATAIPFGEAKKGEQPVFGTEAYGNSSNSTLLNWYRQLIALGHSNRTIATGAITVLDHDGDNVLAWVRRPAVASAMNPPMVVLENLSNKPVTISLKADIQTLHLRGSFLRTVLRTDDALGAMHLDSMTLKPYQVFIGELRY